MAFGINSHGLYLSLAFSVEPAGAVLLIKWYAVEGCLLAVFDKALTSCLLPVATVYGEAIDLLWVPVGGQAAAWVWVRHHFIYLFFVRYCIIFFLSPSAAYRSGVIVVVIIVRIIILTIVIIIIIIIMLLKL
jgi:hypothetical protein